MKWKLFQQTYIWMCWHIKKNTVHLGNQEECKRMLRNVSGVPAGKLAGDDILRNASVGHLLGSTLLPVWRKLRGKKLLTFWNRWIDKYMKTMHIWELKNDSLEAKLLLKVVLDAHKCLMFPVDCLQVWTDLYFIAFWVLWHATKMKVAKRVGNLLCMHLTWAVTFAGLSP